MGMMLPNELIWVMEKLGFEWPDIDEDELRRGGEIVRLFRDELEMKIQVMDRKVNGDLAAAMRGQAGPAYVSAWNTNRSQNLQSLLDLLGPVPTGVDIAAGAVLAMKLKVIADVTTTMITLVAMLTNPITAAGAGPMLIIKKKLLNAAVDIAVEQVLNQVLPMVIEPLAEQLPGVIMAALDSPVVEAVAGDPDEFYADLQALEQAEGDMEQHAADVESLTDRLMADLAGLNLGGD
ncbi:WXG100-like domain-containing protein [Microbacterium sp. GXF0217]